MSSWTSSAAAWTSSASLETVTAELAERLARYNLPASWAVADPAVSAATERLLHAGAAHEIAILGDRSWVGREAGRARFARELARRVTRGVPPASRYRRSCSVTRNSTITWTSSSNRA